MPRHLKASILPFALIAAASCLAADPPPVERVGEDRIAFVSSEGPPRVDLPYFDDAGDPRWDDAPIHQRATGACDTTVPQRTANGLALYPRRPRMLGPRVDERRCPRAGGSGTDAALIGLDATGNVAWQRPLAFPSGKRQLDQWLIGATPEGLVTTSLEVWSPRTGETLVPAATHPVGPEKRPVPDHQLTGSAVYDPKRGKIFAFTADVSLTHRAGGLYRIDPQTGTRELLRAVSASLTGAYERVESMALSPDGRLLLLARRSSARDTSAVSLAAFDLESKRYVFQQRHGAGHACSEPRVTVGPNSQVAFSYRDANDREHVLVRYRLTR